MSHYDEETQCLEPLRRKREPMAIDLGKSAYTARAQQQRRQRQSEYRRVHDDSDIDRGADDLRQHPTSARRYTTTEEIAPRRTFTTRTPVRPLMQEQDDFDEIYLQDDQDDMLYCNGWHVTFRGMFIYTILVMLVSGIGSAVLLVQYITR